VDTTIVLTIRVDNQTRTYDIPLAQFIEVLRAADYGFQADMTNLDAEGMEMEPTNLAAMIAIQIIKEELEDLVRVQIS
jgi:hypothetical protein